MAIDQEFRALVEERLNVAVPPVRTRPMFGGVGIYSGDLFFALIAGTKLYFKVSELNQADFEAAGMEPFYPFEDDPRPMSYWEVPSAVFERPEELKVWADKAVAVAEMAKRPRAKKPRGNH